MKKLFKISALIMAAGAVATLAGCAGCSGCNGSSKNTALTSSNWYTGTSYKGIQPSFIKDDPKYADYSEKIIYKVEFDGTKAANSTYSVDYTDGTFYTEFYATHYDWNTSAEAYKSDKNELVYYYKNELKINVRYTMKKDNAQSELFEDHVINECYFRAAGKNLQPVYSKQVIKSTTPANYQATSLANAYFKVDAEYVNYYNADCTEVTGITTDFTTDDKKPETKTYSLNKVKTSVFDNSSLYIAMRSLKLSDSLSQPISLFTAASGGVSTYNVSGSAAQLGTEEKKDISAALADKELYTPVTKDEEGNEIEDKGIDTVAVNVNYTGGNLQGTTQTVWYAAIGNSDNNVSRATMLKISMPLSYNLGTLNFVLNTVESTLWS